MLIAVTNPTKRIPRPAGRRKPSTKAAKPRLKEAPMRKHRAVKAAKRTKKRVHRNPTHFTKHRRRRVHRNPSPFSGKGVLGELLSKEGAIMIGAAFVAPMAADFIQEKLMPTAQGWTKLAVKAAIIGGGAYALDRFLKQRKGAIAFAVTGAAVLVSDAVRLYRGQMAGLSEGEADWLSTRPELLQAVTSGGGMAEPYRVGMAEPYTVGMADAFAPAFG